MPFDRRKLRSSLKQKGFAETEGSNHIVLTYEPRGVRTSIATSVSRGSDASEIDESLAYDYIAPQLKLRNAEFDRLIQCPMGANEYYSTLIERGDISADVPEPDPPPVIDFGEDQVQRIQEELQERMDEDFEPVQSVLFGKIEDGELTISEVEKLQERGVLTAAGVDIDT